MTETTATPGLSRLILRQAVLLAVSAGGAALVLSADYCGPDAPTLWPAVLLAWLAQSMFWLGWRCNDLKLLALLAAGWVGVATAAATLIIFVGAVVASTGDQTTIRIGASIALLVPLVLLPRIGALWPSRVAARNLPDHLGRAAFVVLQYAGTAALIAALIHFCNDAALPTAQ
ncbi:MAG: hypothetical protein VYB54_08455 [Pseudomonadota bacterium]|nr:hypothetical protein [Pseudomonadota bacterium]